MEARESTKETKKRKYDQITKLVEEFNGLMTPTRRQIRLVNTKLIPNAFQILKENAPFQTDRKKQSSLLPKPISEQKIMVNEISASKEQPSSSESEGDFMCTDSEKSGRSDDSDTGTDDEGDTSKRRRKRYTFEYKEEVMQFYIKKGKVSTIERYKIPEGT